MQRDLRALREPEQHSICAIAAAVIASSVVSAGVGLSAAKSAAKTQAQGATEAGQLGLQAAREAAAVQLGMFNTIRGDLSPYRNVGAAALPGYYAMLGLAPPPAAAAPPTSSTIDMVRQADGSWAAPSTAGAAPQAPMKAGDTNWGQVLKDRPDVQAEYDKLLPTIDWNSPWAAQHGFTQGGGPEGFAQWWHGNNKNADDPYQAPVWTQDQIDKLYPQTPASTAPATPAGPAAPALSSDGIQSYLEGLPGYKFVRQQGMDAVRNQITARGLGGVSGAFGKGLARFVTGLADTTYGEQLDRLGRAVGVGQSAANQTGAFGSTAASGAAGNIVGGGKAAADAVTGAANAAAAGTIGGANAITGGVNNAANAYLTSRVLSMYSPGH